MSKPLYRTANGQIVNVDNLRLVNQTAVAVGNMGVNARGDRISPDGTVIETRNEIMKKRYNSQVTVIKDDSDTSSGYVARTPRNNTVQSSVTETEEVQPQVASAPVATDTPLEGSVGEKIIETYNTGLRGALASSVTQTTVVNVQDFSEPLQPNQPKLKRI